jgi:Icc protein
VIRLAHLSDLHLAGDPAQPVFGLDSTATLAAVLDAFDRRADAAVLTGDLAETAEPAAYRTAVAMTRDVAPEVYAVPGNHDDPDTMRDVLGIDGDVRSEPLGTAWTLVLVNSHLPGAEGGCVDEPALATLEDQLAHAPGHVAVAVHHPPASTCADPRCGMVNGAAVLETLRRPGNVRAVLSGHLHRRFVGERVGMQLVGAPSTVLQLEHAPEEPHYRPAAAPPGAHLVELHDDGSVRVECVEAHSGQDHLGNIRPLQ